MNVGKPQRKVIAVPETPVVATPIKLPEKVPVRG